jgi:ubiquinol-cytochrome c reductase iron-sulfur subunit
VTPPPDDPKGTSADAAGSIRDRLKSPVGSDEANAGGDSRESGVSDASFQQTDSAAALAARGRTDQQESPPSGADAAPPQELIAAPKATLSEHEQKVAERKVAALFLLSLFGVLAFCVWYVVGEGTFGEPNNEFFTPLLGVFMALALGGIGAGAVLWAKSLMTETQVVQERHPFASSEEEQREVAEMFTTGLEQANVKRRPLLLGTLALGAGSLALLPLPFALGMGRFQHKERELATTAWREGMRLYRSNGTPVRLGDLQIGSVESVFPDIEHPQLRADSPVLLIRMRPEDFTPREGHEGYDYEGHVAYSSICTHLGCPVKLYEQQTHHLLCPCHQSTFRADIGAEVIFGPAARALPQLAISVDEDGYFVAQGDFDEPIGPSYWERDSR